jgi:hypothetical protein
MLSVDDVFVVRYAFAARWFLGYSDPVIVVDSLVGSHHMMKSLHLFPPHSVKAGKRPVT